MEQQIKNLITWIDGAAYTECDNNKHRYELMDAEQLRGMIDDIYSQLNDIATKTKMTRKRRMARSLYI